MEIFIGLLIFIGAIFLITGIIGFFDKRTEVYSRNDYPDEVNRSNSGIYSGSDNGCGGGFGGGDGGC